jgi:glycosyltransferase involved in cell wall biosynthesis
VAAGSRLAGVPFVAHLRNVITRPVDARTAKPFQHASAVICISKAVRDSAYRAGLLSPKQNDRICIIPDGRNLSNYEHRDGTAIRAELGIAQDVPLVGMVARIEQTKGQDIFLEMAALVTKRIPSSHFLLVGHTLRENDSKYLRELKRRSEDPLLRHRVVFLGYRSDIPDILAGLDCFVHPSRRGAFVSVLIEAMATGVPLVVSEVDGIPECVGRDGAAELIKSLRPEDFANAVVQILSDPGRKARMSLASRRRAQRFDAVRLAQKTERVFKDVCESFQSV